MFKSSHPDQINQAFSETARPSPHVPTCARAQVRAESALEALRDRGAHFVLHGPDKRPIAKAWQKNRPEFEAVVRHSKAGGLIGVIPASVGCAVVDVDEGDSAAVREALGAPLVTVPTPRGHHLWYRAPGGALGNRTWKLPNAHGDIRGSKGSIIVRDPAAVAAGLDALEDSEPVDLSRLPKGTNGKAKLSGPDSTSHWFARMLDGGADYAQCHAAAKEDKPFQRRTWKKANPSMAHLPDLEIAIAKEAGDARKDPSALASFRALR